MAQTELVAKTPAEISRKCVEIIDRLPQRELLREDDIRAWVDHVVGNYGEMATWHAVRAGGFGGSEIGVLVRNHQNVRADHQASAHDLVLGKLLRKVPDEPNCHMLRGHENEPLHAQRFYKKYGAKRDEKAYQAVAQATGLRQWMRYSPDDVVLMPRPAPDLGAHMSRLVRYLIDYKAPSVVEQSEAIAFQYACQLHMGALVAAKAGVTLDGLMLSQSDWANYCLKDDEVSWDEDLARQIIAAGDHFWAYVMRGEVPRYVVRPRFEGEQELQKQMAVAATRVAQLKALEKAIKDRLEKEETALRESLAPYRMAGTVLQLGELKVTAVALVDHAKVREEIGKAVEQAVDKDIADGRAFVEGDSAQEKDAARARLIDEAFAAQTLALKKKDAGLDYDAKAMQAYLKKMGVPLKQFAKDKYDDALAFGWAEQQGLDPEAIVEEQLRFSASPALQEQARDMVAAFADASVAPPADALQEAAADQVEHGQQDDREGLHTERSAPRSISA